MKNKIKNLVSIVMKRWNEYMPLLAALLVWLIIGPIIRVFDPSAGIDDAGLMQALVFGLVIYFAACVFSWIALRLVFPLIGRFVDELMESTFNVSTNKEFQLWYVLALFAVYFIGAVIVLSYSI